MSRSQFPVNSAISRVGVSAGGKGNGLIDVRVVVSVSVKESKFKLL
jgi:hypothetical protein